MNEAGNRLSFCAETVPMFMSGDRGGFIYFITDDQGAIKIGFSGAPRIRLVALQSASSLPLRIITAVAGTESGEKALHRKFAHLRTHGEWFRDGDEIRLYIKSLRPKATKERAMTNKSNDFPRDTAAFKTWADAACTTWPEHLTALAYNAMHDGFDQFEPAYAEFRAAQKS